ncbi:DMT family transporter [Devosia algicola]|uniref:DMT family transporter n=1 Tax=Devosia algicola TaxID=3026418 RepID=A0ABY7YMH1_9HYPH|nr:DMT family transporter [Devosia algicola]WDR02486.1 DMT family transporter [Devosia algicola]
MTRTIALTCLAMVAFAANSVLTRQALGSGAMDAVGFAGVRLVSGAIMLALLVTLRAPKSWRAVPRLGNWQQAGALLGYAIAFSLAYALLSTGTGALLLFVSVQFGMIARAVWTGDRPGGIEWLGIAIALAAFVYLVSPGLSAPDPLGSFLMVIAGLSWAGYSLLGRGSARPLADAAGSFVRLAPIALIMAIWGIVQHPPTSAGVLLAIGSGAIASGLGYAIWYAALPFLSRTRAAVVQLSVPAIAALGAALLFGEVLSARLIVASIVILGGIAIAIVGAERRRVPLV